MSTHPTEPPIAHAASVYTFAFLDPVNHLDPSGLRPLDQQRFDDLRTAEERAHLGHVWQPVTLLAGAAAVAGTQVLAGTFDPRSTALGAPPAAAGPLHPHARPAERPPLLDTPGPQAS